MPPERWPPDDPREWLNRARSNLALAQVTISCVYLEDLCFDAQQAAEKSIKAVLIARGIDFPYTHDLTDLLSILERLGIVIPPAVANAGRLSRFAVVTRYPGIGGPVTADEHRHAVAIAKAVVAWAEEMVRAG